MDFSLKNILPAGTDVTNPQPYFDHCRDIIPVLIYFMEHITCHGRPYEWSVYQPLNDIDYSCFTEEEDRQIFRKLLMEYNEQRTRKGHLRFTFTRVNHATFCEHEEEENFEEYHSILFMIDSVNCIGKMTLMPEELSSILWKLKKTPFFNQENIVV